MDSEAASFSPSFGSDQSQHGQETVNQQVAPVAMDETTQNTAKNEPATDQDMDQREESRAWADIMEEEERRKQKQKETDNDGVTTDDRKPDRSDARLKSRVAVPRPARTDRRDRDDSMVRSSRKREDVGRQLEALITTARVATSKVVGFLDEYGKIINNIPQERNKVAAYQIYTQCPLVKQHYESVALVMVEAASTIEEAMKTLMYEKTDEMQHQRKTARTEKRRTETARDTVENTEQKVTKHRSSSRRSHRETRDARSPGHSQVRGSGSGPTSEDATRGVTQAHEERKDRKEMAESLTS